MLVRGNKLIVKLQKCTVWADCYNGLRKVREACGEEGRGCDARVLCCTSQGRSELTADCKQGRNVANSRRSRR